MNVVISFYLKLTDGVLISRWDQIALLRSQELKRSCPKHTVLPPKCKPEREPECLICLSESVLFKALPHMPLLKTSLMQTDGCSPMCSSPCWSGYKHRFPGDIWIPRF